MKKIIGSIALTVFFAWNVSGDVLVQFGGNASDFSDTNYQAQVGASNIVQWFGADSDGYNGTQTGSLKDKDTGATLTSVDENLIMTSLTISSSDPTRTNTVVSGRALGINEAGSTFGDVVFNTADATAWTFEFNKDVTLHQMLFTGFGFNADEARVTIGGDTYEFKGLADAADATWITGTQDRVYTFTTPVDISAGTDVTVTSLGTNDFGLGGVVVAIPEPATLGVFAVGSIGLIALRNVIRR